MKLLIVPVLALALLAADAGGSLADELELVAPVTHQATRDECGECHMAYQPALLPRESWAALMDGLAAHFGEDASLPSGLTAEIRTYLLGASAPARRPGPRPILAITEQRWWLHEHDDIRAARWQSPQVGAKGNCPACHRDAERGLYDDEDDD